MQTLPNKKKSNPIASREVSSNQQDMHPDLISMVKKHSTKSFKKPVTDFNRAAFEEADKYYEQNKGQFILDSGCGTGESTWHIAKTFPNTFVLGVDQSADRLSRNNPWLLPDNACLIRADLVDLWRLALSSNWKLSRHYLLYPNPWPKKKHLQRRWHGHPVFPVLKDLGGKLELRTNWKIYGEEFSQAMLLQTGKPTRLLTFLPESPISAFERKYQSSGQDLYQLKIDLD